MGLLDALKGQVSVQEHQFNAQASLLGPINRARASISKYSSARIRDPNAIEALESFGISTTDIPSFDHPHPTNATIFKFILTRIIPNLLNGPTFVLDLKPKHAQELADDSQQNICLANPVIELKDIFRYKSNEGGVPLFDHETMFVSDAAHHYSPSDVVHFYKLNSNLKTIIATLVIPPELLDDLKPLNPAVYTFEKTVDGKDFHYYPDGHIAGKYTQTMDCLWWLKTRYICDETGFYSVQILDTIYAHHVIAIRRGKYLVSGYSCFAFPNRVKIPKEVVPYLNGKFYSVERKMYEVAMSYVTSLGSVKLHQIKSRIRMTANSIKHGKMLSDEFVALQLVVGAANRNLDFMPDGMDVFTAHHLLTRTGPVRWIRLMLRAPSRAAWENFLNRMDLEIYTAQTELGTVYTGSEAPLSAVHTNEIPAPKFLEMITLARHILLGSRGNTHAPTFLGGNVGGPFASIWFAKKLTEIAALQLAGLLGYKRLLSALAFALKFVRLLVRRSSLMPITVPLTACLAFALSQVTPRLYRVYIRAFANLLRRIPIAENLPTDVKTAYFTIKLAGMPTINALQPTKFSLLQPVAVPTTLYSPVNSTPPTTPNAPTDNDNDPDDPPAPNPKPNAWRKKKHGRCNAEDCSSHDAAAPITGNQEWISCDGGHGYWKTHGTVDNKCHICRDSEDNGKDIPDGTAVPICGVPLTHPTSLSGKLPSANCVTRGSMHFTSEAGTCELCCQVEHPVQIPMPTAYTCLLQAIADASGYSLDEVWAAYSHDGHARAKALSANAAGMNEHDAHLIACRLKLNLTISASNPIICGVDNGAPTIINYRPGHYFTTKPNMHGGAQKALLRKPKVSTSLMDQFGKGFTTYRANIKMAANLAKNFEKRHIGVLIPGKEAVIKQMKSVTTVLPPTATANILVTFGLPGTGKSYPWIQILKQYINDDRDLFRFVTMESDLREDAAKKFNANPGLGYRIATFELPFVGSHAKIMVLDDYGKFPPGYLDLLLAMCPGIEYVLINGDPAQPTYHCPSDGNTLNAAKPAIDEIIPLCSTYKFESTRYCCGVAHYLGLPHKCNGERGKINFNALPNASLPVLTGSSANKRTLVEVGRTAYTAAGAQGITIKGTYEIHADKAMDSANDRQWFAAMTRGTNGINIIRSNSRSSQTASALGRAILSGDKDNIQKAIMRHISSFVPPRLFDVTKMQNGRTATQLNGGHREADYVDSLIENELPHLSGILDNTPEPQHDETEHPSDSSPAAQILAAPFKTIYADLTHGIEALLASVGTFLQVVGSKEEREISYNGEMTDQVDDSDEVRALFIRHHQKDKATAAWTQKERFVHPDGRTQNSESATGITLYNRYMALYQPTFPDFNEAIWEDCGKRDQETFLDKGINRLAAIKDRAQAEWLFNEAETFMKGQSVTKPGTIGREAKKGQLIISFCTELNFRFGRLAKYLALMVREATPTNFYTLDGNTDKDTTQFIRDHWNFDLDSSEDDYEGFDSTQGPEFQVFDALLMRAANIPESEIDFYLRFLPTISTCFGILGPMMASGFKFTLLLNTERSKAYQATKYDIAPNTAMACTGDDVACNSVPPYSTIWGVMQYRLALISKRSVSRYPVFCGWVFNPVGCFKLPGLLLHRTAFQLARNNLPNCLLNYMADITPLNANMEAFSEYLTPEQIKDHYITLDILRAEAKRTGINAFGNFYERYGAQRTYDVTVMNGGCTSNKTATQHTQYKLATPRNPAMPYTFTNTDMVAKLYNAHWATVAQIRALGRLLQTIDYSVVDQRREGHKHVNDLQLAMFGGEKVFDDDKRFDAGLKSYYLTTADTVFSDILVALAMALSYRATNVAKDTDAGLGNSRGNGDKSVALQTDQGAQDNTKRFEELVKQLLAAPGSGMVWNRAKFEQYASWTEPASTA